VNVVLLHSADWETEHRVRLRDRRADHLRNVLAVTPGDTVRVGVVNGALGLGRVVETTDAAVVLIVELTSDAGPRHPFDLVLALPRPKMLRRVLRTVAEFGVSQLHLINSYRVEKSYWQSPLLAQARIEEALLAGLERAGDTRLPEVQLHHRFRPFVEDVLPALLDGRDCLIAHPGDAPHLAQQRDPAVLLVGPEGGFIPFELALAQTNGARQVSLGQRILSVDTAVTAALACAAF
jgi:RsmE family RNA methyltransferase